MDLDVTTLLQMARDTVRNPREGARLLMQLNLPMSARWTALLLMAVLSAVFTHLSIAAMPLPDQDGMQGVIATPIRTAVLQVVVLLVLVQGSTASGDGAAAPAVSPMRCCWCRGCNSSCWCCSWFRS